MPHFKVFRLSQVRKYALYDSAWSYDSIIGAFTEPKGYDDSVLRVYIPEPLGSYDNR